MRSETLLSACYLLFDESNIPFYSKNNGYYNYPSGENRTYRVNIWKVMNNYVKQVPLPTARCRATDMEFYFFTIFLLFYIRIISSWDLLTYAIFEMFKVANDSGFKIILKQFLVIRRLIKNKENLWAIGIVIFGLANLTGRLAICWTSLLYLTSRQIYVIRRMSIRTSTPIISEKMTINFLFSIFVVVVYNNFNIFEPV